MKEPGRNDACPCGSGRKYRHCCGPRDAARRKVEAAWALMNAEDLEAAQDLCRQATQEDPRNPDAWHLRGILQHQRGRHAEAAALVQRAIGLHDRSANYYNSLGNILVAQGRHGEAVQALDRALALRPDFPQGHYNRGIARKEHGDYVGAIESYRTAIALEPGAASSHYNLAQELLRQGDFAGGWDEYEWRWRCPLFDSPRRDFSQPPWDGGGIEDRTLLLHAEQGLGDTLQFCRYVPVLQKRAARLLLECQPALADLMARSFPGVQVIARGDDLPVFDVHCPLLSVPRALGTTLATIPAHVPYLAVDAARAAAWEARLSCFQGARIGLVWAGNPQHRRDAQRSIPLRLLASLAEIPRAHLFSLQVGAAAEPDFPLHDYTSQLRDFSDTAALVSRLDLVIGVDTAAVHLAGALCRPAWVLLAEGGDWRWLLDRVDSPWYPSLRLFRQSARGDWDGVARRVASALRDFIQASEGTLTHAN